MNGITRHLLRGAGAVALIAAALAAARTHLWPLVLVALPVAILLLGGCPMCWLLGLADHLRHPATPRGS